MVHTFSPNTHKAEASGSTEQVPRRVGTHRETLSCGGAPTCDFASSTGSFLSLLPPCGRTSQSRLCTLVNPHPRGRSRRITSWRPAYSTQGSSGQPGLYSGAVQRNKNIGRISPRFSQVLFKSGSQPSTDLRNLLT